VWLGVSILPAAAQTRANFRDLLRQGARAAQLAPPEHLRDYVRDGKLRLGLQDAILLMLENNSAIRVEETQVENAKFSLLAAYKPFDPQVSNSFSVLRSSYPGFSQLQGPGTFNDLNHSDQLLYSQTFQTGTSVQLGINGTRDSNNSGFYFINPNYQSYLSFQFTQPLFRDRWRFENRAPLLIARRNLDESRAHFEAQTSDAILNLIKQYWAVVEARDNLDVVHKSLAAAEASYQHDKRKLELGALPPLDIYRSEAEVASRRVQALQAEYGLKQAEDALRLIMGANQDSYVQALDLELTEKAEPEGELRSTDTGAAIAQALSGRPELEAAEQALRSDETGIRLAENHLLPDLSLSGIYQSWGVGGNQYGFTGQLITRSGLGTSFHQLFGFGFPVYGATLKLSLPLRNRAAQAEFGTALVKRRGDLYSRRQIQEQIALDVTNAVHQLEEAKLTLAAGKTALDLAQKSLAAEQRKTELGAQNIFFQLDAQTRVAEAEASLLNAEVNYQLAVASLDHATGELLQAYRVKIRELSN
jgi:outer membrane protein TolC